LEGRRTNEDRRVSDINSGNVKKTGVKEKRGNYAIKNIA